MHTETERERQGAESDEMMKNMNRGMGGSEGGAKFINGRLEGRDFLDARACALVQILPHYRTVWR